MVLVNVLIEERFCFPSRLFGRRRGGTKSLKFLFTDRPDPIVQIGGSH
jgi:hypothetical protein